MAFEGYQAGRFADRQWCAVPQYTTLNDRTFPQKEDHLRGTSQSPLLVAVVIHLVKPVVVLFINKLCKTLFMRQAVLKNLKLLLWLKCRSEVQATENTTTGILFF